MSDLSQWLSHKVKAWSADVWDGLIKAVDARFAPLEEQLDIQRATTEAIVERGLNVIEFELAPVVAQGANVLGEINTIKTNAQIVLDNIEDKQNLGIPINDIVNLGTRLSTLDGHAAAKSNPHETTKSQVGLGNVDNTSDADKPISSATQSALNGKKDNFPLSDYAKTLLDDEDAPTARATLGAVAKSSVGLLSGFRNKLINGNFDVWQRGPGPFAANETADRWHLNKSGATTVSVTRQTWPVGDMRSNGTQGYYCQADVTSVPAGTGACNHAQRIERVSTFQGELVTVGILMNLPTGKKFGVRLDQHFGSGGAPSSAVTTEAGVLEGTGDWNMYLVPVTLPSISGQLFGTNGDDALELVIDFAHHTLHGGVLDGQTGLFKYSKVFVMAGDVAGEVNPMPHIDPAVELLRCQRFYWRGLPCESLNFPAHASNVYMSWPVSFPTEMRAVPALGMNFAGITYSNCTSLDWGNPSKSGAKLIVRATAMDINANFVFGAGNYIEAKAAL